MTGIDPAFGVEQTLWQRQLTFHVGGIPRPQGSMKAHATGNGKIALRYAGTVIEWRAKVEQAAIALAEPKFTGPVELRLGFELPRPLGHFLPVNSRRVVPELRPGSPVHPTGIPDLDKLCRAIGDALTNAELWDDDAQCVSLVAAKRYAVDGPGVYITILEL